MRGMKRDWIQKLLLSGIGFFVGRGVVCGINPLAVAFFTAIYMKYYDSLLLWGLLLAGIFSKMSLVGILKYGAVFLLIEIFGRKFRERQEYVFISLYAAASVIGINILLHEWFGAGKFILTMPETFLESVIVAVGVCVIKEGMKWDRLSLQCEKTHSPMISAGILFAVILYGIPWGGSFSCVLFGIAFLVILIVSYSFGASEGTFIGTVCGSVFLYQSGKIEYLAAFSLLGLSAGVFRFLNKTGTVTGLLAGAVFLRFALEMDFIDRLVFLPMLLAAGVFLMLPESFIYKREEELKSFEGLLADQYIYRIQEKIRDFSKACLLIKKGLNEKNDAMENMNEKHEEMFLHMKENLCNACTQKKECYHEKEKVTYQAATSIFDALEKKGGIDVEDVPTDFAGQCLMLEPFMIEANRSFERQKAGMVLQKKLKEGQMALAAQFQEMADVMQGFAASFSKKKMEYFPGEMEIIQKMKFYNVRVKKAVVWESETGDKYYYIIAKTLKNASVPVNRLAQNLTKIAGVQLVPTENMKMSISKDYEVYSFVEQKPFKVLKGACRKPYLEGEVTGDNFSFQQFENGDFIAMLADGMGTGKEAEKESRNLIEIMEQLLETGVSKEQAIRLSNTVMTLNPEFEGFSTLDICSFQASAGICTFFKMGASTTFIKRDGWVDIMKSTTLPAGVFVKAEIDVSVRKLYKGDMVIMVSDGVVDAIVVEEKEEYLKELILNIDKKQPQDMAEKIIDEILSKGTSRVEDDMTICAFKVV